MKLLTANSKNILIADDSLFFRIRLSDILIEAGYKVKCANNGIEVLEEIKTHTERIDLLILDLQMPEIDGFGVLDWLKNNGNKTPVLAVTGVYEKDAVIERLHRLGASGFMRKDLSPEQIIFRINRLVFFDKAIIGVPRERVPVSIPADFTANDATHTGVLLNLSPTGAFLHSKSELKEGMGLELNFSLPGINKILRVKGIVRWSPYEIENKLIFCGYGVMFTLVSPDDQEALNDFVAAELTKWEHMLND